MKDFLLMVIALILFGLFIFGINTYQRNECIRLTKDIKDCVKRYPLDAL